jgi:pimeloyl-ACP methyl ester carboxylesterase
MIWKLLRMMLASFVVLGALLVFGCAVLPGKMLFHPTHAARANSLTPWVHEGKTIGFAREVTEPRAVWLMLHGNGGQAADREYALPAFDAADSVFILEYPGYGLREGKPSRKSIDAAAREGYAALRARFPGTRVCVAAESIGSGPAAALSGETPAPDKIAFVVPFDTLAAVGKEHMGYLPVDLLLAGYWNNLESMQGYRGPVDIFGAERDGIIPVKHAQALAADIPQARFQLIAGGHNEWSAQPEVQFRCP